ncbi:MAG: aldehyde dehydrogenase family protein [Acidobacteriota bacterium]|nr:aldehyde dehydrogenase family protein [Acidobacteriota bacterium]
MLHIPLLRAGEPYRSLATRTLAAVRDGEPVAEVSQANPGLVARDLARSREGQARLAARSVTELVEVCRRAAEHLGGSELPVGDEGQSPGRYLEQVSATTGLPRALARANLDKACFVLREMETVLGGLTRGLDPEILDRGWGVQDGRMISYRRETPVLGAVLPNNSPGVHSLWLPAIPLKVTLALRPGGQEPWTPYRIAQAFLAAGCPPEAFGFYPSDHAAAAELLQRCGRSMLYGDEATVAPWRADPRVQLHGPGWSKVVLGPDAAADWPAHLPLLAESVAANGGRSCTNASGVWTASRGRELALGLAAELAKIEARPLDDPQARLAAFPTVEAARRLSAYLDERLLVPGAEDLTARFREDRVAVVDGCGFVLPTVVYCSDPDHPLARAEFLFPFVSVVDAPAGELVARLGSSLVVTALTADEGLLGELVSAPHVERLNLGPVPTPRVAWDQPHEGNLFELLYRQRSLQAVEQPPAAARTAGAAAG